MVARLERDLFVEAPPERVFELLAQPERTPEWSPNVVAIRRVGDGPIGVGSTTHALIKALGTQQRAIGRCTVFDPPRRIVIESRTDLGARSRSDSQLVPEGSGTRLRATLEYVVPGGGLGQLFDKLVAERQTREDFEQALLRLKRLLEAGLA
ncbi:MAG: SRPBCC family protein [Chloroflexi bacterium]|nr:SRPBCC family protein [Chloroflexota bacterium]